LGSEILGASRERERGDAEHRNRCKTGNTHDSPSLRVGGKLENRTL